MNVESESIAPEFHQTERSSPGFWLKQFLVGNPFYIVSAAFLLYGIYRISMDPHLADMEMRQLMFNFSSLQVYGFLLTLTALFLARRCIWYDSTLLVVIESSLLLIPFLLVSQAISLDKGVAHVICGLTALLAGIRFSLLKAYYPKLNFPSVLLACGAVIVAINGALPLLFKSVAENSNAALVLDVQEAGVRLAFTGILPILAVLAVLMPRSGGDGELRLPQQKQWLPLLIHFLWITATAVHFYSIRYVYRTPFEVNFFAPTTWVITWVLVNRLYGSASQARERIRGVLLTLPAIVALPALWPGRTELGGYFLACNLALYAAIYLRGRNNQLPLHLAMLSLAAVVVEVPKASWQAMWPGFNGAAWVLVCAMVYLVLAAITSRNPKLGLAGAVCFGLATSVLLRHNTDAMNLAAQAAFGFILLHSIAWRDAEEQGAKAGRIFMAICWALHSFFWAQSQARFSFLLPATISGALVLAYFALGLLGHIWASRVILFAAAVVLVSTPASFSVERTRTTSPGVLAVIGSFLLFGVGTWFALAKSKWFKDKPCECAPENLRE